ncbi:MAE_28990/MAE_18760 family HEPN-like nuclease [Achromobacter xylosoxidans]|uniref:MAE_28990/MAE_18760 family HEPN-like nuclease n=1 Tax=Alcaligenes xylosoxydans xylosoxydans TaxID=85698 RepID=UPI001FF42D7A|nr:MAE_28990/MAE_18760 family HEPN-like nuclease [Achromobacter xylosoxidans]
MTTLLTTLSERKDEFVSHLALAQAMEERLLDGEAVSIGETALTVRHLMTIKSGLIVHLYNIVEALMSRAIEEVGGAVKASPPDAWSVNTLKEWLRFSASIGLDGNEDSRLEVVHKAALKLLMVEPIENLRFKKPSGTWSDKVIFKFLQRLNVTLNTPQELTLKIQKSATYGDKTPLEFLADRRNAIAHGRQSFERGAVDLSLSDIKSLADVTIEYMEHVINSFQAFVDEKHYLAVRV